MARQTDIPQVERGPSVQPAGVASGYQQAVQSNAKEHLFEGAMAKAGKYEQLAKIGAQIGQSMSNQFAEKKAIEAAQNPGRKLLPAFTESDSVFVQAYKKEEANVLNFEGNKYLNNLYQNFSNQPHLGQKDLTKFQEASASAIDKVVQQSNPTSKAAIKRSLEETFMGQYADLTKKVVNNSLTAMKNQRSAQAELTNYQLKEAQLSGRHDEAKMFFEKRLAQIDNAAAAERWPLEKVKTEKAQERENYETGIGLYNFLQKEQEQPGSGQQVIEDIVKHPPAGLDAVQKMNVAQSVAKFGNQYEATLSGQRQINYINLQAEAEAGTLTQAKVDNADISGAQRAHIYSTIANKNAKENQQNLLFSKMQSEFGDIYKMNNYTDKQMNASFDQLVSMQEQQTSQQTGQDYKATLVDQANLAQDIQRRIPVLEKRLEQVSVYGNPDQAIDAVRAMRMLDKNNPIAIQSMSPDAKNILDTFDLRMSNSTENPYEAIKIARDESNVSEEAKKSRIEAWKSIQKLDDTYNQPSQKLDHIVSNIQPEDNWFWESSSVPEGIEVVYDQLMAKNVQFTKDYKVAENRTFEELKRVYKQTNINNEDQIMKYAPPDGVFFRNDKLRALKEIVESSKSGMAVNKLEWPDAPDTSDLIAKDLLSGNTEILVDGIKRKIVVDSDYYTNHGERGPSWSFSYLDENGEKMPLMDAKTGTLARWYIDYGYLDKAQQEALKNNNSKEYKGGKLKEAIKYRKELNDKELRELEDSASNEKLMGQVF